MRLYSSLKGIFFSFVKCKPFINRYSFPSSLYFYRASSSIRDLYSPFTITRALQSSPEILKIQFADTLSADFHYLWLRDCCNCDKCVHQKSNQKLLDTTSLDLNIYPRFSHITSNGQLKIVWPDKGEDHVSLYEPWWLYKYAVGFTNESYEVVHDCLPPTKFWTGQTLKETLPEIEYEEVMQTEKGIIISLQNIHKYGITIIRNVPCERGEVTKVMNRIAHVETTRWGSSFHITAEDMFSDPAWLTYLEKNVELHTDMDYLEKSPGIQALHCLSLNIIDDSNNTESDYGTTHFVDGFHIAECLRENYPRYFETLVSVPVKFKSLAQNMTYINYHPVLKLNRSRNVREVHFNNRMMSPMEGPFSAIMNFYAAYKEFGETVRKSENQFSASIKPGDMIIISNRRVLHGRSIFDPSKMRRHLEGCYADMDDVLARYRSFILKKIIKDHEV